MRTKTKRVSKLYDASSPNSTTILLRLSPSLPAGENTGSIVVLPSVFLITLVEFHFMFTPRSPQPAPDPTALGAKRKTGEGGNSDAKRPKVTAHRHHGPDQSEKTSNRPPLEDPETPRTEDPVVMADDACDWQPASTHSPHGFLFPGQDPPSSPPPQRYSPPSSPDLDGMMEPPDAGRMEPLSLTSSSPQGLLSKVIWYEGKEPLQWAGETAKPGEVLAKFTNFRFGYFPDRQSLARASASLADAGPQHLLEVIDPNMPSKLYFDIERYCEHEPDKEEERELFLELMTLIADLLPHNARKYIATCDSRWVSKGGRKLWKTSLHPIFSKTAFATNHTHLKAWMDTVLLAALQSACGGRFARNGWEDKPWVDYAAQGRNQALRVTYAGKPASGALVPWDVQNWKPLRFATAAQREAFCVESLCSDADLTECTLIEVDVAVKPVRTVALVPSHGGQPPVHQSGTPADRERCRAIVEKLSVARSTDRVQWRDVGFAISAVFGGDADGLHVFDTFSQRSPSYKEGDVQISKVYQASNGTKGLGSLVHFLRQDSAFLKQHIEAQSQPSSVEHAGGGGEDSIDERQVQEDLRFGVRIKWRSDPSEDADTARYRIDRVVREATTLLHSSSPLYHAYRQPTTDDYWLVFPSTAFESGFHMGLFVSKGLIPRLQTDTQVNIRGRCMIVDENIYPKTKHDPWTCDPLADGYVSWNEIEWRPADVQHPDAAPIVCRWGGERIATELGTSLDEPAPNGGGLTQWELEYWATVTRTLKHAAGQKLETDWGVDPRLLRLADEQAPSTGLIRLRAGMCLDCTLDTGKLHLDRDATLVVDTLSGVMRGRCGRCKPGAREGKEEKEEKEEKETKETKEEKEEENEDPGGEGDREAKEEDDDDTDSSDQTEDVREEAGGTKKEQANGANGAKAKKAKKARARARAKSERDKAAKKQEREKRRLKNEKEKELKRRRRDQERKQKETEKEKQMQALRDRKSEEEKWERSLPHRSLTEGLLPGWNGSYVRADLGFTERFMQHHGDDLALLKSGVVLAWCPRTALWTPRSRSYLLREVVHALSRPTAMIRKLLLTPTSEEWVRPARDMFRKQFNRIH
jgi:hypothetical protein